MRYSAVMMGVIVSFAVACSGSKKKADDGDSVDMSDSLDTDASTGDSDSGDTDATASDGDADTGANADGETDAPDPEPKPKPYSKDDDYEIGYQDCDALAGAYSRAWRNDELAKLNERKLKKAAFDKAAAEVKSNAGEMSANWKDECYKTVGTAYLRSRLKCAMKAKSMQKFNNCMDGVE